MTTENSIFDDPLIHPRDKARIQERFYSVSRERRAAIRERREARKTRQVEKFLFEKCVYGMGNWCPLSVLYASFLAWNNSRPIPREPESKILFSRYLQRLGYRKKRGRMGEFQGVYFSALGLQE